MQGRAPLTVVIALACVLGGCQAIVQLGADTSASANGAAPSFTSVGLPNNFPTPIRRIYADPQEDRIFAAGGSDFVVIAGGKAAVAIAQLDDGEQNAQQFHDFLRVGSTLLIASDKGLWRCPATPFESTACVAQTDAHTTPDSYRGQNDFRALALADSGVIAVGEGVAFLTDANAGTLSAFYDKGAAFTPDKIVLAVSLVDRVPWMVVDDSETGARGLCVPAVQSNPFASGIGQVSCLANLPPALVGNLPSAVLSLAATSEASDTVVYIGTAAGLIRYDVTTATVKLFSEISGNQVTGLAIRKGIVWAATPQGLWRIDPQTGGGTRFDLTHFAGATSSDVGALAVDRVGLLWVSIGSGPMSLFTYSSD